MNKYKINISQDMIVQFNKLVNNIKVGRVGHYKNARRILLEAGIVTVEAMSRMSDSDVIKELNKNFIQLVDSDFDGDELYIYPRKLIDPSFVLNISRNF